MLNFLKKKKSMHVTKNGLQFMGLTDIGKKYKHNEDYFVLPLPNNKYEISQLNTRDRGHLFILCDGMGGAKSGEVASELAANWTFKAFYGTDDTFTDPIPVMKKIIQDVNHKIYQLSKEHEQYEGMATTLVCTLFFEKQAYFVSVGDSRAYRFRAGELTQITEDQSEVWGLYKMGSITKEDMQKHPRKHIIDRALGLEKNLLDDHILNYQHTVEKGDLYLINSDGLTDMVDDQTICQILEGTKNMKKSTANLIEMANKNGGRDNITAILIKIGSMPVNSA